MNCSHLTLPANHLRSFSLPSYTLRERVHFKHTLDSTRDLFDHIDLSRLLSQRHVETERLKVTLLSCFCCSDADVFTLAGHGGVKREGRKTSVLEELFGNASESEASTFHGFEDGELEDIFFSDDDDGVVDTRS